jgi:hypothetical protein
LADVMQRRHELGRRRETVGRGHRLSIGARDAKKNGPPKRTAGCPGAIGQAIASVMRQRGPPGEIGARRVPTSSWLLVLVLGGRRVGLDAIARKGPALDVAQLMAKYGHGQVLDLGAADQARPGFLRRHLLNLAPTSLAFHRV